MPEQDAVLVVTDILHVLAECNTQKVHCLWHSQALSDGSDSFLGNIRWLRLWCAVYAFLCFILSSLLPGVLASTASTHLHVDLVSSAKRKSVPFTLDLSAARLTMQHDRHG